MADKKTAKESNGQGKAAEKAPRTTAKPTYKNPQTEFEKKHGLTFQRPPKAGS